MNIDYLREFIDLSETLNFTKSAANMRLSQSTLSRHISDLERQTGARLLDRTTTTVSLTDAGREFYEKATIMLRDYDGLLGVSRRGESSQPSMLRVGGYTTLPVTMKLFGIVNQMAASRGEGFRLRFHRPRSLTNEPPAPHPLDMLLEGDVDLIMEAAPFDAGIPRGCAGLRVCDEPLVVVVSAQSPLATAERASMDELVGTSPVTFVVYRTCPDIELAPLRAAGLATVSGRPVYVRDLLEIPERAALMDAGEIAPLERGFCDLFGLSNGAGTHAIEIDDERMRLSYWLLCREGEQRPNVLAALRMMQSIVETRKSESAHLLNGAGNLWSSAL